MNRIKVSEIITLGQELDRLAKLIGDVIYLGSHKVTEVTMDRGNLKEVSLSTGSSVVSIKRLTVARSDQTAWLLTYNVNKDEPKSLVFVEEEEQVTGLPFDDDDVEATDVW